MVILALTASTKLLNTQVSLPAAVLSVTATLAIVFMSHVEHVKSVRPSFILTTFLLLSSLFDVVRIRTEWLLSVNVEYVSVLSVSLAFKVALLAFETVEKRRILVDEKAPSSESTSGPLNRGLFLWLNSLFLLGWKESLTLDNIPDVNEKLESASVSERFTSAWHQGMMSYLQTLARWLTYDTASRSRGRQRLFLATINAVKWDILFIVPPRILMIGLQISQPFLISHALRYLNRPDDETSKNYGYGLIGAFALVFIGSAVSLADFHAGCC